MSIDDAASIRGAHLHRVGAAPRASKPPAGKRPTGVRAAAVRCGVFVLGGLLVLLGVAAWMFSVLLTAPLLTAGLWVWSHHFTWAHRLLDHVGRWAQSLRQRAREHPLRWGVATAVSLGVTGAGYWWLLG